MLNKLKKWVIKTNKISLDVTDEFNKKGKIEYLIFNKFKLNLPFNKFTTKGSCIVLNMPLEDDVDVIVDYENLRYPVSRY